MTTIKDVMDLMERYLPCPPSPMPELNTEADYLWRATLFNARQETPRRIVEMVPRPDLRKPPVSLGEISNEVIPIIRVECDERGRGIRVLQV